MATGAHTQPEPSARGKDPTIEETPVPLGGRQQKPTAIFGRFKWSVSDGGRVVVFTWYLKSIDTMPMKYTNVHIILIRQFREALLLLYFLVSQCLEALSVLSGGWKAKHWTTVCHAIIFTKRCQPQNRLSIHHFLKPTFKCGQSFERLRSCEISMDGPGRDVVP